MPASAVAICQSALVWLLFRVASRDRPEPGVLAPRAGTDGGPTARRQRDPVQVFRWRSRSEPSTSDERLVVTTACAAVRSFVGATADDGLSIDLLSKTSLAYYFPEAEIWKEKMFGLTKSLVAIRD